MAKTVNMTRGNPLKLLFFFALPLMFGNVFQQLYTVVDVAIVGRGVGMDALAALGTVDWLNWMLLGIAYGYTQGISVRISQKYGEGAYDQMGEMIRQSAVLSAFIAAMGTLVGQVGLPLFLTLLRVPEALVPTAMLYTRILIGGFPVAMFYNFCSAVLRAVGNSKTPLIAMIVASVVNILLDLLAVFVLGFGVAGAAVATVIAQCFAGFVCIRKILKTKELRFSFRKFKLSPNLQKDFVRIGTPIAARNVIIAVGGMVVQTIVNGFGLSFIAGFTATGKLYGLLEIAALSYGYAVTTYVGQNYGASLYPRIKDGMRSAVILSTITSVIIGGIMIAFGKPITMLFISSQTPELELAAGAVAYEYLCVMASCLPILYLLYIFQSALQGMGNTLGPMLSGIVEFILRVGVAIVIGIIAFERGIFLAETSAWLGAAIFSTVCYCVSINKYLSKRDPLPDVEVISQ